jgi:hypothetical protein
MKNPNKLVENRFCDHKKFLWSHDEKKCFYFVMLIFYFNLKILSVYNIYVLF